MAKKSRWGRMVKLGGLTSRVSSSYLGQRISGVFQGEKDRESSLNNLHLKNALTKNSKPLIKPILLLAAEVRALRCTLDAP